MLHNKSISPTIPSFSDEDKVHFQAFNQQGIAAKKTIVEFTEAVQKKLKNNEQFSLSDDQAKKISDMGKSFSELGQSSLIVSQLALIAHANPKTCRGINMVGGGLLSFCQGLQKISEAKSLVSLSSFTGGLSAVLGVVSVASALFGDDDEENGLGEALQQIMNLIGELYYAMQECFRHLEELINENMAVLVFRLNQITNQLNRLENIMTGSFKEVHSMGFKKIFYALNKDIEGENHLTKGRIKSHLSNLSTWIDDYSKSPLQTFLIRDSKEANKSIEILNSDSFDPSIMLPFLLIFKIFR